MIYVYLITVRSKFEYSNNSLENKWTNPSNLYCYKKITDAQKDIWIMKQKEAKAYSSWLRQNEETRGLFIHHVWDIEKMNLFNISIKD